MRLDKPTPWASGQVTDAQGFSRARANARTAGDDTHLVEVTLPGRSWTELHPDNALLREAGSSTARVVVDVPLSVDGSSLGETAAGAHDASWRAFGEALGSTGRTSVVRLRLPDGGNPDRAKLAFRRASQLVREGHPLVKVEWAAPVGSDPRTAAAAFPGADAVDIIGLQIPASGTWTSVLADDGGLLDWADWASRTGRPVALHWQLTKDTNPQWVRNLNSWIQVLVAQRRMSYETMAQAGTPTAEVIATYRALW